jgi:hypothetical protein
MMWVVVLRDVLFLFVRRYRLSLPLLKAGRMSYYYVDVEEFLRIRGKIGS